MPRKKTSWKPLKIEQSAPSGNRFLVPYTYGPHCVGAYQTVSPTVEKSSERDPEEHNSFCLQLPFKVHELHHKGTLSEKRGTKLIIMTSVFVENKNGNCRLCHHPDSKDEYMVQCSECDR